MEQYTVTGMSCAACSTRVEKAVSKVDGVTSCSVSLLTNSMGVEGAASPEAVIAAVEQAGYGASKRVRGGAAGQAQGAAVVVSTVDQEKQPGQTDQGVGQPLGLRRGGQLEAVGQGEDAGQGGHGVNAEL